MFEALEPVAAAVGLTGQEFRFLLCLLLAYPAALLYRLLPTSPSNTLRHLFSFALGFGEAFLCFEWDAFHALGATVATYLIMLMFRRHCGWLAFGFNIAHLTWGFACIAVDFDPCCSFDGRLSLVSSNYDRLVNDYLGYSLNWTVPQMIMCCKLSALAWNYFDGALTEEQIDKETRGKDNNYRKEHRLVHAPSFIAVLGYSFFFAGWLTGPWGDFVEYNQLTDKSLFAENGGRVPSSAKFILSRIALIIPAFIGKTLAESYPVMMTTQDSFWDYPVWQRMFFLLLAVELFYCKYYIVWWLGEGACALIGYSYNGKDEQGSPKWDRIRMVDLWRFKFGTSAQKDLVPSWNIPSQLWLKRYVHVRLIWNGVSGGIARLATFVVSAIWHGLYPGYYVFFVFSAIFVDVGQQFGSVFLPHCLEADGKTPKYPHKFIFDMFARFGILFMVDYLAISFQLMAFEYGWKAFSSVYFAGHITIALAGVFVFLVRLLFPKKKSQKKAE